MPKNAAILIAIIVILFGSSWVAAQGDGGRAAPGQVIYDEHCARCHGLTGKGDGPDAAGLIVPPANFHSPKSRSKSEYELLTIISYGIVFSPMHAWRGKITDDEMLELVGYIRKLAPLTPIL